MTPAGRLGTAVLLADTTSPSGVHGVHGAAGLSHWKCLAGQHDLTGQWEAVEWASVPPGGVSGEHRHTRTEELYFILAGEGEMALDGTLHPVTPRSLVLTGLGTVHGLRNTGDTRLDWLVVEVRSPHTTRVLTGRTADRAAPFPPRNEDDVNATVLHLTDDQGVDPGTLLTGPLRLVETRSLPPSAHLDLESDAVEHTVFVLGGSGRALTGDTGADLAPGVAVTLPRGTGARLLAGDEGLRLFHAELSLNTPAEGER
ncbi:cupin domain-containing protein [Streptomyces sp. PT12]|uniref:cupin domain-containing protein n=1 Tax=Streptomyces sp. PT12 TaxID=1510197 RepID=UPI000DE1C671|nr:cupin domain-containing protein [Streptomyces sp. PT12]RBM06241.1 cupin domain-containing protein [Streptomyces sp. PT12]